MRWKKNQEKFKYLVFLEIAWNTEQMKKGTINLLVTIITSLKFGIAGFIKFRMQVFPILYHTKLILIIKYLRL